MVLADEIAVVWIEDWDCVVLADEIVVVMIEKLWSANLNTANWLMSLTRVRRKRKGRRRNSHEVFSTACDVTKC